MAKRSLLSERPTYIVPFKYAECQLKIKLTDKSENSDFLIGHHYW